MEEVFPLAYQESYDNSGLQVGNPQKEISSLLLTVDITEEVIEEARRLGAGMIISHHPLIFQGLKRITGNNATERCVALAIRYDIALYACHTNADNLLGGVSSVLAGKLGLKNTRILSPLQGRLRKLVTFVPHQQAEQVRQAIFAAGAGHIGEYDLCSYNTEGTGTFRGSENTNPFAGEKMSYHKEPEIRIETILPAEISGRVVKAMLQAHPYEEPAYDLYPLENSFNKAGAGVTGELEPVMDGKQFLQMIKEKLGAQMLRHSALTGDKISRVAVCGGSGAFLIREALRSGVQALITADLKYHQFFEPEGRLLLVDAGHYETEQFTKELFYEVLIKKFPNFAVRFSEVNSNPVNYI